MSWFRRNTAIATTCWLAHYKHDPSENAWWMQPCLISRLFSALSISLGHTRKQENFMDHPCSSPKSEAWATSSPTRPLIQWCTVCEYGCKGQRPRYPVECVKDLAWCARVCNLCFTIQLALPKADLTSSRPYHHFSARFREFSVALALWKLYPCCSILR